MDAKNLRAEAMRLPAEERRALGQEPLESVFGGEHLDEANWRESWAPEIQRRLRELDSGCQLCGV